MTRSERTGDGAGAAGAVDAVDAMDAVDTLPARSVAAQRLAAQRLSGAPARHVVDVVERILAVQAQDGRGMRLAVRSRSSGLHASDVDAALSEDRSVVVTWLNRGTLHLVRAEDYWWLHGLTAPRMAAQIRRRLREEGVSPPEAERGVEIVRRTLAQHGPATRDQLRERLDAAGVPTAGQALYYVLVVAAVRNVAVRGPVLAGEPAYALVDDWLGPRPRPFDRDAALAELAVRYLTGHGPAEPADLARWVGLPLGDARRAFAAVASKLTVLDDGLVALRSRATDRPPAPELPEPRLLGSFDPVLHGWASRDWVVGQHRGIVTTNGVFRPIALVAGRAVATWSTPAGRVHLAPFAPLAAEVVAALRAEATAVERFLATSADGRPTP